MKIVFTGSESTAKTTISEQLAEQFGFAFVPEFAREYIDNLNGRNYTYEDVITIAEKQKQEAEIFLQKKQTTIFDTDLITTKIWLEYYNRTLPNWLNDFIKTHKAGLYLLMKPDIAWQPDPQRKNPHDREFLFSVYEKKLQQLGANYRVISGIGEIRVENCRREIEEFLSHR